MSNQECRVRPANKCSVSCNDINNSYVGFRGILGITYMEDRVMMRGRLLYGNAS